jgi:hypothetical protein
MTIALAAACSRHDRVLTPTPAREDAREDALDAREEQEAS